MENPWKGAADWLRNNYHSYSNVLSICEAMEAASPVSAQGTPKSDAKRMESDGAQQSGKGAPANADGLTDSDILKAAEDCGINAVTDERRPDNATIIDFARTVLSLQDPSCNITDEDVRMLHAVAGHMRRTESPRCSQDLTNLALKLDAMKDNAPAEKAGGLPDDAAILSHFNMWGFFPENLGRKRDFCSAVQAFVAVRAPAADAAGQASAQPASGSDVGAGGQHG